MIRGGVYDINSDTDKILSFLAEWYVEYCINEPLTLHQR